ncbi:cobalt chelatase [Parashewanella curva]|uniref:Cobalt chelatase n=1 Tax=Parashewanella curva TaxID=2338552 RepID=A0A3L8PWC2_9GAMM|nr:cobalt chelatase [Parashewanella curva]RLV59664.1 cobalt chelatase [Parashewanella curva]
MNEPISASEQQARDSLASALISSFASDLNSTSKGQVGYKYQQGNLYKGTARLPFYAPHTQQQWLSSISEIFPEPDAERLRLEYRGRIDALALRLQYSDLSLHLKLKPKASISGLVFEMLEQLRVECLISDAHKGMKSNINHLFEQWSHCFHSSGLTESSLGILLYTLAQMSRARLLGIAVSEETEHLIEHTRFTLSGKVGKPLNAMRWSFSNQADYAQHALEIAHLIEAMAEDESGNEETDEQQQKVVKGFAILLELEAETLEAIAKAETGTSKVFEAASYQYKVFTTEFDKSVYPEKLIREELLKEYRQQLDDKILSQKINVRSLARYITAKLNQTVLEGRQTELEEGYIDAKRLNSMICSPSETSLFYQACPIPKVDTAVSFLVDCSGSMKTHAKKITLLLDILSRAFDIAEVKTEVLGFTTGEWNGGQVLKQWRRQRSPENPGRLNSIRHMIFKHSEQNWRKARLGIVGLQKLDLYKEGIDGEAIEWASQRLLNIDTTRKILVVLSDGCPMDTATNQANDKFYLDNHLKAVIAQQYQVGIEMLGLGVGVDLSPYYEKNMAIDIQSKFDFMMLKQLVDRFSRD